MNGTGEDYWHGLFHGYVHGKLFRGIRLILFGALLWLPGLASAQQATPLQRQEQLQRAQRQAEQRRSQQQQPDVRMQKAGADDYRQLGLPQESPCFTVRTLRLGGQRAQDFPWLTAYLHQYLGRCVGQRGLNLIVRRASDLILARGYVTTRLLVPQQDLSSGTLRLMLVPGIVGAIRYAPGSAHVFWRNALPVRPGDILNLRVIEQGLEQLQRVPSQQVHINIAPGDRAGVSDLVLDVQRTKPWHVYVNSNNAGLDRTGRGQLGLDLGLDQPLGINDLFSAGVTHDTAMDGAKKGTRGYHLGYSVPWGNWTFAVDDSGFFYHMQLAGTVETFQTSGRTNTFGLSAERLLFRDATSKTSLRLAVDAHAAHSYIEGVEIDVQRRHTRSVELALLQRRYIGRAQLDLRVAQRRGVPWFGGQRDAADRPRTAPTFHYIIDSLDASLSLPFDGLGRKWLWSSTLHGQYTRDRLYAEDFLVIGGRYTVRGFDGNETLGSERGWFWRNSVGLPLNGRDMVYAGADIGAIGGPDAQGWTTNVLSGAFIGCRGARAGLNWDLFAGWELHAPRNLSTLRPALGMQVIYQF